jgi:hypothetical protein
LNHVTGAHQEGDGGRQQRRPGEWPVPRSFDTGDFTMPSGFELGGEDWLKAEAERAEQIIIFGRFGAYMDAQPSPRAVRAYGRRWASRIVQLADTIATAKTKEAIK